MTYYEIATTDWGKPLDFDQIVIDLADWMIDVHKTLERSRNTAYAYEGIIHAYELARRNKDKQHMDKLLDTMDRGLYKLISWQIHGPIENEYLREHPTNDRYAVGGVMNHSREPLLRIDVTQHMMHAVILARRYVYRGSE